MSAPECELEPRVLRPKGPSVLLDLATLQSQGVVETPWVLESADLVQYLPPPPGPEALVFPL